MGTILAIDPGNTQSGYVVVEHDGEEIRRVLEAGKIENPAVTDMSRRPTMISRVTGVRRVWSAQRNSVIASRCDAETTARNIWTFGTASR